MIESKQRVRDLAAISFLVAGAIALFGKVIYSGETLYGSDFLFYFYPTKRLIYDYFWANGFLPFWNPYLFSGTPLIANMQASMFYPLGFLYFMMPTDAAYLYSTLLHSILGAVFMYLFVRSLGTSSSGAFLSGLIFVFNGYFVAHIYAGHLSFVQNYIWIPLVFLFARKFMETQELKTAVLGGLALGVQILGGFPQIAFYTMLAVLLLCLYSGCVNYKNHGLPYIFRISAGTVFLLVIGFLISAIQLIPTYEFIELSTRAGGIGYDFATIDSLPPRNLLTFLFPLLFGSPADGTYWINDHAWEFWEYCAYVGIATLAAILLSIRNLLRDRMGLFFVLLGLAALFLAFGKYNPVYPLIYRLPGFNSFRIPAQVLFLYVFSVSVLSGKAIDILKNADMFQEKTKHIAFTIFFFILPLVIWAYAFPEGLCEVILRPSDIGAERLGLIVSIVSRSIFLTYCILFAFSVCWYLRDKGSISRGMFIGMLIGLYMIDLWSFAVPLIRTFDIREFLKQGQALSHITKNSQLCRSVINGKCFIENAGLWYGFQDIQGYDPLILRRYVEYINKSQGLSSDDKVVNLHYIRYVNNPLIRMLNLKYVADCETGSIRTITAFIPRCYIVHHMETMKSNEVLDALTEDWFDPLNMVIFEDAEAPGNVFPCGLVQADKETCNITLYGHDEIKVTCNVKSPGFLIMSEINYPGWHAYVDGEERRIFTGNYLFRTVSLEAGNHEIRFIFRPVSFRLGTFISAVSIGVAAVLILLLCRRRRHSKG